MRDSSYLSSEGRTMQSSDKPAPAVGTPTLVAICIVVVAFMALSLAVTAIGTGRFAVAMGYDVKAGYAVGGVFDLAKGFLLMALLALWGRRSLGLTAVFGIACACLVTFSWLATHATVSTAIGSSHRSHRTQRHLEDGGSRQHQGRAGVIGAPACHLEPIGPTAPG